MGKIQWHKSSSEMNNDIDAPYFHTGTHFVEGENCEKCGGNPMQCDPTSPCEKDCSLDAQINEYLVDVPFRRKADAKQSCSKN